MVSCYTLHDWPHNLFIRLALGPSQHIVQFQGKLDHVGIIGKIDAGW